MTASINNDERCKIPATECSRIIDNLFSSGNPVSTQDIYDKLEQTYRWVEKKYNLKPNSADYTYRCREGYSAACKEAIKRLIKELQNKKKADILIISEYPQDKRKKVYQYRETGFSVYKNTISIDGANLMESEFEALAIRLLQLKSSAKLDRGDIDQSPKDIDDTYARLQDILTHARLKGLEKTFKAYLEKLYRIKTKRNDNWITECSKLLLQIKNDYSEKLEPLAYADFLIEYADFIANYDVSKEDISLKADESVFEFSQNLYLDAINRATDNNDKEKQALFLVKYGEFMNRCRQCKLIGDICETAVKLYEEIRINNSEYLESEYATSLHLTGSYFYNILEYEKSELYYKKAYDIRQRLSEKDSEKYDIELAKTLDCLANLYTRLNKSKDAFSLYNKAYEIRSKHEKRNSKLYKFEIAKSLYHIGVLYMKNSDYDKAIDYIKRAISIEENLANEYPEIYEYVLNYSTSLEVLSKLHYLQENYSCSEKICMLALPMFENLVKINKRRFERMYADFMLFLSVIHQNMGEFEKSDKAAFVALDIFKSLDNIGFIKEDIVNALIVIADNYKGRELYVAAERYLEDALQIAEKLFLENETLYAQLYIFTLTNKAFIEDKLSKINDAEQKYKQAIEIIERMARQSPDEFLHEKLTVKKQYANHISFYRDADDSLPIYNGVIEEYKSLMDNNKSITIRLDYAGVLYMAALSYKKQDIAQRIKSLSECISFYKAIECDCVRKKIGHGSAHLSLALEYCSDSKYSPSFEHYETAIELYTEVYKSNPLLVTEYLGMSYGYYGLALEDEYGELALEKYAYAIKYYIEDSLLNKKSISELKLTLTDMLEYADYDKALYYLRKICPEVYDKFTTIMDIRKNCMEEPKFRENLKQKLSVYDVIEGEGRENSIIEEAIAKNNLLIAQSYTEEHKFEKAYTHFKEAIKIYNKLNDDDLLSNSELLAIANSYFAHCCQLNGDIANAMLYYYEALCVYIKNNPEHIGPIRDVDIIIDEIISNCLLDGYVNNEYKEKLMVICNIYQKMNHVNNNKSIELIKLLERSLSSK